VTGDHLAYYRKSIGRAGISRQRTATTAHVEGRGGRIIDVDYADTDSTAYARPGQPPPPRMAFARLLADLPRYPGVTIAAWHADRVLRNPEDTEVLIRACVAGGHLITTARGGDYDLSTATGRKRLRDDANDAAYEVDHARERILLKQAELRAEGRWSGGRRPFGWQVDGEADGGLVLDGAEAALIRQAADDVLAGVSLNAIARQWNDAGAAGRQWTHVTVRQVLVRPLNASLITLAGAVAGPGRWAPVLDDDTYRAVRAWLSSPGRRTTPGPSRRHLLSGIALCGACGAPLAVGGTGGRVQYRCRARKLGLADGTHAGRLAAPLDEFVTALATGRLKRPDAALLLRADNASERRALLAREVSLQDDHDALWPMWRRKVITDRELTQGRAEIAADIAAVRGQLAALDQADALAPMLGDPDAAWKRAGIGARRAVVAGLMYLTVFPASQGRPAGTPRGAPWFDVDSVDVRWVRRLPSDG
jgi:site-specific DNA recombinase